MSEADAAAARARAPRLRLCLAALAVLAATGCASSPYRDALDTWTRSEDTYRSVQARALTRATLQTVPFRRAYVAEYARLFALTPEQREALLEAQLLEADERWVVVVAFYVADRDWNDLDPAHGVWEVRLEGPHGWLPPTRVRHLRPTNPTWKQLFPYFKAHFRLYELHFERGLAPDTPLARPGEALSLVIAGAVAQIRMSWVLP